MKPRADLYRTTRIETTHIYQNHIDKLLGVVDDFCSQYDQYEFSLLKPKPGKGPSYQVRRYLAMNEPKSFRFAVRSREGRSELVVDVSNGVSISVHDGTYELYALSNIIEDELNSVSVSGGISFLRRYWLFSLLGSIEFIPAIFMFAAGNWGGAIAWLILAPIGGFMITVFVWSMAEDFWNNLEWDDVILSTKIKYDHFSTRASSSVVAVVSSTKVIVSILASLATIASFIFVIVSR